VRVGGHAEISERTSEKESRSLNRSTSTYQYVTVIILLGSSHGVHSHFGVAALCNSVSSASNMCSLYVFIGTLTAGVSVAELSYALLYKPQRL